MSTISFQCAGCQRVFKVSADKAGLKAKCKCGATLTVPGSQAATPPPLPPQAPIAQKSEEIREPRPRRPAQDDDRPPRRRAREEDDDDKDDRPPRLRPREEDDADKDDRPRRRRPREADDEDEDDRPRRRRPREEDDDDEDEDRPRRRRQQEDDDDEDEEERRRRAKKETRQQLRALALGLACYWWKYLLAVVSVGIYFLMIISTLLVILLTSAPPPAFGFFLFILAILALLVFLGVVVMGIIGSALTVRVSPKSGCRGLGIANLFLECIPPAFFLLFMVLGGLAMITAFSGPGRGAQVGGAAVSIMAVLLLIVGVLCLLAGFIVFMLFMRKLALYLGDKATARMTLMTMIQCLVTPIVGGLIISLLGMLFRSLRFEPKIGAAILLSLYLGLGAIQGVLMVRIMNILNALRARI